MTEVVIHGTRLGKPLNRRKRLTVELPEFVIRAIKVRVEEANRDAPEGEEVNFNDVIEWLLVSEVSIRRMPLLESSTPGFSAAMAVWLLKATYPLEDEEL